MTKAAPVHGRVDTRAGARPSAKARAADKASVAVKPAKVKTDADGFTLLPAGELVGASKLRELHAVLDQRGPHARLDRAEVEQLSFSALAAADVPAVFDDALEELKKIRPSTTPDSPSLRPVRKSIERLRNNLDLFASVYPMGGHHGWSSLRHRVDAIYESLGHLKDLSDSGLAANASLGWSELPSDADGAAVKLHEQVLPQRQEEVTKAIGALTSHAETFRSMLERPTAKPKQVKKHDANDSRFYWGGVKADPSEKRSGLDNIRRLLKGQVHVALHTSKAVLKLDEPIGKKHERDFHDFRKRVRSLINVAAYFPEVFKDPARGAELQRKLYSLVFEYGEVEDRLVRAHTAAELGDSDDSTAAKDEIRTFWPMLVRWQKDEKISGILKEFEAELGKA